MSLPPALTRPDRKQYLLWRYESKNGDKKPRKVPYYVNGQRRHGTQGTPEDRNNLATFSDALEQLEAGDYSGVGIAMLPGAGLVGVDLDNCFYQGELSSELKPFADGTYAEVSPSGQGVRAFYFGEYPDRKDHKTGVEIFHGKGFLTITGDRLNASDIAPLPDGVRQRLDRIFKSHRKPNRTDPLRDAAEKDRVYRHLRDKGFIKKDLGGGRIGITCPFENEHTTGAGDGDCVYFLPNTNGYTTGNFNCLHAHCAERGNDDFLRAIGFESTAGVDDAVSVPTRGELTISLDEWEGAELTPKCFVQDFLYADVAVVAAPGGTGKTTMALYEAIHILLGRPLYGLDIVNPGWSLFITAEDSRPRLIAILRQIANSMSLSPDELEKVRRGVSITPAFDSELV
jgi:hypothetical protein